VKDWTSARALVELIANALDEDPHAHAHWSDGVLTIHDQEPGIPRTGLLLGASRKTSEQIGQFGEGKKLAALVLARDPEIGTVQFDTVGYSFTPALNRARTYPSPWPGFWASTHPCSTSGTSRSKAPSTTSEHEKGQPILVGTTSVEGTSPAERPWGKPLSIHMPTVISDLRALGGPYAAQADAIETMPQGRTPYDAEGS
jgi:hypothetical protein